MMPAAAARFNHVIAFDVAKATLSLHILPSGETLCLQNDGAAVRRFLKREQKRNRKQGLGPILVICEATGGYEHAVRKPLRSSASIVTSPMDRASAPTPNSEAGTPKTIPSTRP